MAIKLSGFEPLFDNAVYGQNTEGNPLVAILRLERYVEPSQNGVLGYLQQKAGPVSTAVSLLVPDMPIPTEGKSPLEVSMMALAPALLRDLSVGLPSARDFVRPFISAKALPEGVTAPAYVWVNYGTIPFEVIESNERGGRIVDAGWYDLALANEQLRRDGYGQKWNVKLRLDNGALPARADIDTLLRYNVVLSPLLSVSKEDYSASEVGAVLDSVYAGLTTPEAVSMVEDISTKILEASAIATVRTLQRVQREMALARLAEEARSRGPLGVAGISGLGITSGKR